MQNMLISSTLGILEYFPDNMENMQTKYAKYAKLENQKSILVCRICTPPDVTPASERDDRATI